MAKKNLSVEEILAACRNADGDGSSAPATPAASEAPADAPEAAAAPAPSPAKPASKNMSVEEMLAAARAEKGGAKPAAAAAAPAAKAPAAKLDPKKMSVADMLAAARGETAGGKSSAGAAAGGGAAAAKKTTAAPAATKVSPKAAASAPAGPRDTSSILAAAKKSDRRGPMSKAEAKAKGSTTKKKVVAPPMPEKPAYAAVKAPAATEDDRRGFMSVLFGSFLAIGFVSLGAVSSLWGLGLARYLFPNILTEPPSQFKVGFPTDFPPGTVTTKFKAQFGVWVVNAEYDGQQMITAIQSICTHLGCTPNWLEGEQKFKCPCHGSGFYKDGINFEGPAPRPLERFAIKIADDGQLEIDKSKKFQQEMGQWKDGTCYVPV